MLIIKEKRSSVLHKRRLNNIQRYLGKPPQEIHLLDVGASSGAFLSSAQALGFKAEGVEPSEGAAETARSLGLNVHTGTLETVALASSQYDVITLFEVIEHLADPTALLKTCHRLLKPSGIMVIGTGNARSWTANVMKHRWEYYHMQKHGGHISFFNTGSMAYLARKQILKYLTLRREGFVFF